MKIFKERTREMSSVNDERRQVLPSKVIWDGTIDCFEVFRNNVEGHYGQIRAVYSFDSMTVMLIFWMNYLLLPRSRRIPTHYMVHYSVHARVV
jgi:hypothetical protein